MFKIYVSELRAIVYAAHLDIIVLDMKLPLVMESSSMGILGNAGSMATLYMTSLNMAGKDGSDETKKSYVICVSTVKDTIHQLILPHMAIHFHILKAKL
ncbi:hypothetical protein VNO78_16539 [Psophocarpus tetragonolobus]|uniref:Uncharacterized protein n=1 Tax=Psophocarpus tetragonolobus TaxID=3891 RepID=A0AAN9SMF8_PSOTE